MSQPFSVGPGTDVAPGRGAPAAGRAAASGTRPQARGGFQATFDAEVARQARVELSGHAQSRVAQRGLTLDSAAIQRLGRALDRAQAKGGRSSLIVIDDVALVANVPERRVVTALQTGEAKEWVFTNIDSVVFA